MNYQEITDELSGQKHIILEVAPDQFKSFPADLANPEYKAWAIAEGIIEADEDATTTEVAS